MEVFTPYETLIHVVVSLGVTILIFIVAIVITERIVK